MSAADLRGAARAALVTALTLCLAPRAGHGQEAERFRIAEERVAVFNLVGDVVVRGADRGDVVVTVRRRGADGGRLEIVTGPVESEGLGRIASLRILYPDERIVHQGPRAWGRTELRVRDDGTFYGGGGWRDRGRRVRISDSGDGLRAQADMEIEVPAGRTLLVHLATGAVEVRNVDGDLTVDVGSAAIATSETRGSLLLDTGSGDVRVDDADGEVGVDTGSGDVTARRVSGERLWIDTGSGDVGGGEITVTALHVDTGSGEVALDRVRAPDVLIDTGSGEVRLGLLSDVRSLVVDTGSGDVEVTLPAEVGASIELDTSSGDVETGFALEVFEMDDDYLRGRLGDGDGEIRIDTGSGDITLRRG